MGIRGTRIDGDTLEIWFWVIIVIGLILAIGLVWPYLECNTKGSRMGMPYEWRLIGGCFVQPEPGKWIPLDSYYFKEE